MTFLLGSDVDSYRNDGRLLLDYGQRRRCGRTGGGDGTDVTLEDDSTGAAGAQTLRIPAGESIADQSLSSVSATYPPDRFFVDGASHDSIPVGVDRDGDGELEEEFGSDAISGANNNDYSFAVTMETDVEPAAEDVVGLEYPAVENPGNPGEYDVEVSLNDERETSVAVAVE
ncbi:hypothetical protein [Halobellus sp. GM3]|uniref:hypothetical protein n=1 Tax=Halobellus sp. GM3 TaxID=3458410 RepID=UPI00403D5B4E